MTAASKWAHVTSDSERLWRHRGELYAACNIIHHDRFVGMSVMVWEGRPLQDRPWCQGHCQNLCCCSGPWVPSGARQCLASCGQSVQAVPQWQRHWCRWLALSFPWPKSNWVPMGSYVLVHPTLPSTTTDSPGNPWCPDRGLRGDPPEQHPSTHQEHAHTLSHMQVDSPNLWSYSVV